MGLPMFPGGNKKFFNLCQEYKYKMERQKLETPFRCGFCGDKITHSYPRPDLTWRIRLDSGELQDLQCPETVNIPSCDNCGDSYISTEIANELDRLLEEKIRLGH